MSPNSLKSAQASWLFFLKLIQEDIGAELFHSRSDYLRFQCNVGFAALNTKVTTLWQIDIAPEQENIQTLIRNSFPEVHFASTQLNRAQITASLNFLAELPSYASFNPNFLDLALILLMIQPEHGQNPNYNQACYLLLKLQKLSHKCHNLAQNFSETQAAETLQTLKNFESLESALSPSLKSHETILLKKAA